eukprot:TRINITY_DN5741_c0_g1_i1.p1 TRINITY_DN5741_c0_g1~~TRINITY_DN5741_c0_g1_i1.p1  ORF type:complete len:355 (+),score=32.02 TRINITY_DN5741_c0_g1_i1:64-1128(+)
MESINLFDSLPNEVLYHLFSVLDAKLLTVVSQVCSEWRLTAGTSSLWASLYQERFIGPKDNSSVENILWKMRYVDSFRLLKTYERAIEIGCSELKCVLDMNPATNSRWVKASSQVMAHLPGMQVWRRDLPQEQDDEWPKEFESWAALEEALLEDDTVDPIDSPLRARMRVAMVASREVHGSFDVIVALLQSPEFRKHWDIILSEGFKLVDLDKNTDIIMLIYANVDCCLVRRREYTMRPGGRRVFTLSEQSVPYSSDLSSRSAQARASIQPYESDPDYLAAVWGSGFRAEELTPGGPCRVSYVVQIVPDPTQLVFANEMIREMQLHRSHCLVMLDKAAARYSSTGTTNSHLKPH